MSTIINALYLQNFFNYYGDYEDNVYEFNSGLNVIVADNGNGKSKLFSAFSWLLKDHVIDSDRQDGKMAPVKNFLCAMISDKAKAETMVNSDVFCGVRVNFTNGDFEYVVEKSIWGRRLYDGSPTESSNWHCELNEVRVSKKDRVSLDYRPINDLSDKQDIIKKLIRPEFLQYALFQGEEVDQILNFSDKNSLKTAVDTITNINKVQKLITLTEFLAKKGREELTDAKKKKAINLEKFNKAVADRDNILMNLNRENAQLSRYRQELIKAKEERDQLVNLLMNAEGREKLRSAKATLERQLKDLSEQHGNFLNSLNDNFFNPQKAWLFYNTQHHEAAYNQLRDDYLEARQERKTIEKLQASGNVFLTKLPVGSPDSFSLRKMLSQERCFVCDREAKKDTSEWLHIAKVLEAHSPKSDAPVGHSFKELLDQLMQSSSSFFNQIKTVNEGFTEARLQDKNYRTTRQALQVDISNKENELIGLGDSKQEVDRATVDRFGGAERRINKYEADIVQTQKTIQILTNQLESKILEIDKETTGEVDPSFQKRSDIVINIQRIAANTKRRVYEDVLRTLEEKSNYYFKELTKSNATDRGQIKMTATVDDTFAVEICDQDGNKVYGLSEGYQRMKKLAVITAIISASERGRMDYPLIADAPLSSFGKGFIQGFFEKIPEVFQQTIIMVKDLYDQSSDNLLNDIGNDVLNKIRAGSGSLHINQVNQEPQIARETQIIRY